VQAWQREGVIDYLGEAQDVRAFIGNADCVVLPSYREGVPRTLMEASAMGRPIVATDVPGCREVVENGVTGLLCEVKSADSLAQQLERLLLSSYTTRAEMGAAGRAKIAREFDENAVVERYKGTIRAVTGVSL
jgi:glycosyltransferase involved in cell wall biosynthesis